MKRLLLLILLGFSIAPAYAQHPRAARKILKHGIELFSKGDITAAIGEYDHALAIDATMPDAYFNRAKARQAYGDLDDAIDDYETAAALNPRLANNRDISQAYLNRGYRRSNALDVEGALSDYDRAILLNPNNAEAYFKRGRAFFIDGNIDFAIADFDKSISLDDRNPLVYAERAFARRSQGLNNEAQGDFDRGLRLNNNLRMMLDLHLLDLEVQIREMKRREAAARRNIA